jgi:hypothetical protein
MAWFTIDEAKVLASAEAKLEALRAQVKVKLTHQIAEAEKNLAGLKAQAAALFPPPKA